MREMKDSGIEWIGAIPQDWKTDRLQWHLKEINVSNNPIQTKNILSLTIEAGVIPYAEKGNQLSVEQIDAIFEKLSPLAAVDESVKQQHIKNINEKYKQSAKAKPVEPVAVDDPNQDNNDIS